jgi:type IV secretory pathway TraG/TraD family ATPase VirD4
MAAMWGAATVKLIGAGVQSPRLARDVSTLVGQHDVAVRSITLGEARGVSEQISLRRQEILDPAGVAAIEQGTALLLASGGKPVLVKLRNWFNGPRSAEISQRITQATALITEGAIRQARDQQKVARP